MRTGAAAFVGGLAGEATFEADDDGDDDDAPFEAAARGSGAVVAVAAGRTGKGFAFVVDAIGELLPLFASPPKSSAK